MFVRLLTLPILLLCICSDLLIDAQTPEQVNSENKTLSGGQQDVHRITEEQLSDEALGSIIKSFGQQMSNSITSEMDKLLEEVQQSANSEGLDRFKRANEALTKDTQVRIEQAGEPNSGQVTCGWADSMGSSILCSAGSQLQAAGAYLGHQMAILSGMAPSVRGSLQAVPGKLLRIMQWPNFLSYKRLYKKVYKSGREELYRQINYLNNQATCGLQNIKFMLGKTSHLLKATQFADMSATEYQQSHNNSLAETEAEAGAFGKLAAAKRSQLERLAKENRNVFGQSIGGPEAHKRLRRDVEDAYNELDESESDDERLADELDDDDDDLLSPIVDEYAKEFFKGPSLADMEKIADDALSEHQTKAEFEPIDLRQSGCLVKPENQGECGCCYAHVVVTAAAYYNCMQSGQPGKPKRLHARFLSDCGQYSDMPVDGCSGGKLSRAVRFLRIAGAHPFQSYELARLSQNYDTDDCAFPHPPTLEDWAPDSVPFFKDTEFYTMSHLDEVDLHLRTVGPVWQNVRTWKDFQLQGPGIHDKFEESENPLIHSMLIVGHDMDANGRDYWILWNSHGPTWGEEGYLRIYTDALEYFGVFSAGLMPSNLSL